MIRRRFDLLSQSLALFFCKNDFFSECWVLPISVLLALAAYAIVAAAFYNTGG